MDVRSKHRRARADAPRLAVLETSGRKRPRLVRARRRLAVVLAVVGALLAAEAVVAVAWQEPFSAVYTKREQAELSRELDRIAAEFDRVEQRTRAVPRHSVLAAAETERQRVAAVARKFRLRTARGKPLARIAIPKLGGLYVVIRGTDGDSLERGPGHYMYTGFPGEGRTVGIAGHRTTYLAPFRHVDKLERGDPIVVRMPYGSFEYRVTRTKIVPPSAVRVLRTVRYEQLVLTACHPLFSDAERIVVFAKLAKAKPGR